MKKNIYITAFFLIVFGILLYYYRVHQYSLRVYPNVSLASVSFGGAKKDDVQRYVEHLNTPIREKYFQFRFEDTIATLSALDAGVGYDATLAAVQAYSIGRNTTFIQHLLSLFGLRNVDLPLSFSYNKDLVRDTVGFLSESIDIPSQDALFQFANNRVSSFKPSQTGRKVNVEKAIQLFELLAVSSGSKEQTTLVVTLPVDPVTPSIVTSETNTFGVKELIGRGYSEFSGSIPGRIHNVALAASKLHGILIPPGKTFSFNDALGDISATTGYQAAYIIKEGRTVLGDGGGVCQVSSTLFRAALNAGLPIVERHAHAYRVHYYEEGGFKPGLDATVYSPTVDLKFSNNTGQSILIQSKTDTKNLNLTFTLYGTSDGRKAEILNHKTWGESAPPAPLYQDDPTLPKGIVRQIDFPAWGANASFQYRVTRRGEVLEDTTFTSNFRPWQAIYLRGV
ncbi:VanW family protein [Candidatus Gottesmanbacteria bacterium]|nr:VanW family protein [Candidatus Gottesmanbacteria bacterium]